MVKNVLFNFIELYLAKSKITFPNCQRLERDFTKEGREYYRFELQHKYPVKLHDEHHRYKLINHHVSVYQTESQANPFLSQYHYTAYFEDEDGTQYQLHVYFNDKNEMTTKPVFSICQGIDSFIPLESGQLHEDFINLACANAKPLIKTIRKQLTDRVKELETRYKTLDNQASILSASLPDNYENYITKLTEISETAKLLIPLASHERYQNHQKFIQRMITAVIEQYKHMRDDETSNHAPSQETQPSPLEEGKKSNDEAANQTPSQPVKSEKTSKKEKVKTPSVFDQAVLEIATQFNKLSCDNEEVSTTRLGDMLARVNELSLELDERDTVVSLDSLATLKNLHQKLHETGEKLFVRLLMSGKFKLAERLPPFYYLLDNYLDMALQTRNHQLLDFILKHGDVNINNQEVNVKGKVYPSAVHCCLGCDTKTTPMVDCLSVLIAHGASVFGNDDNGLPIAHTILLTQNHPLKKAFTANREKTIESIPFYKQLISILKLYIAEKQPSQKPGSTSKKVVEAIAHYQEAIEELQRVIIPSNPSEKRLKSRLETFTDKHDTAVMEKIREDAEVIALKKKVQIAVNAFHKRLDYRQRVSLARVGAQNLENVDKTLEYFGIKFDNFQEVKQITIDFLQHTLVLTAKQSDLVDLQKKIRGFQLKPGTPPKSYTDLLSEQKELLAEIGVMEKKFALEDIEKVKSLDVTLKSLSDLSTQFTRIDASIRQMYSLMQADFDATFAPESGKDKEEEDEVTQEKGSSNVNTVFNMFASLLGSVGREENNVATKDTQKTLNPPQ